MQIMALLHKCLLMCTVPDRYMHLKKKPFLNALSYKSGRSLFIRHLIRTSVKSLGETVPQIGEKKKKKQENKKTLWHIEQCFHALKIHHPSFSYLLHFLGVAGLEPVQLTGREAGHSLELQASCRVKIHRQSFHRVI